MEAFIVVEAAADAKPTTLTDNATPRSTARRRVRSILNVACFRNSRS
jgi:hypothetical protein